MLRLGEFRFLLPLLRPERGRYVMGAVLVLFTCACWIAVPKLVGIAIRFLESGVRVDLVSWIARAMIGAVLLRGVTMYMMRSVMIGASRRVEFALRNRLFRHLESLDASFYVKIHTGDLINRFTSDVEAVRAVLGPGVMYTLNTLFTLVMALYLMFQVSVSLTLYSLLPLLLLTVAMRVLGPRVNEESMRAQERLSDINIHAQENFSNVRVVKAFVREDAEGRRMDNLAEAYFAQNMRLARLRGWINALLFLIGDLALLFLLALGGLALLRHEINLGDFAAFKGYQLVLIWPMLALGWVITIFQRGAASARRLREILEVRPKVDDAAADSACRITEGALTFDGVCFGYGPDTRLLRDIGFHVEGGETLGLVGATGSGKTTLLQLIPRLYPVEEGDIRVDGQSLPRIPLERLREGIGYVPQEPFLFSATVEENIAFGVQDAPPDAVREVARLVRIHEEIEGFPDGYQQRVGERGITLSGGQKQRIALARALLKRPRILLLDDVLSAVDAQTESEIIAGLRKWTANLTTLIVSHRLSAVRHADNILVLSEGRIAQSGTHDELVSMSGYYSSLHQKQTLEDELENL